MINQYYSILYTFTVEVTEVNDVVGRTSLGNQTDSHSYTPIVADGY